jgi:NitT/TauT family transport system substrate-binding protein
MFRLVGMLAGLSLMAAALSPAQAQESFVVQGGSPVPNPAYLNTYVAQKAGFFAEEGLEVEIRYTQGAALATQLAASNSADIADVTFEPYLLGYSKGLRGKFIYSRYDQLIYWLAVPVDSDIKSAGDLAGKKIGVASMASSSMTVAKSLLRSAGIDPTNDMFLPVGTGDQAMAALAGGQVQALSLWDAVYGSLERAGHKFRYIYHPEVGDVSNGGFFASDQELSEKADALQRFLRAQVKARIFIKENPEAALQIYWEVNPAAKPQGTQEQAVATGLAEIAFKSALFNDDPVEKFGQYDLAKVQSYMDVLKAEGVFTEDLKSSDLVTNDLIAAASRVDPVPIREKARNWGK